MRRILTLTALLCLLLLGCSRQSVPESVPTTQPPTTVQTEPTEPAGCYLPDSELEASSNGALRVYRPDVTGLYAIYPLGDDLLAFSGVNNTVLSVLSGDNLYVSTQAELRCDISPYDPTFTVGQRWISYYDYLSSTVIYLDHSLKEINTLPAPEGMVGAPVLSPDMRKIYYCTDSAVRVWDLDTEIDRVLKEITVPYLHIAGTLMDGEILSFRISPDELDWTSLYISTETGEILYEHTDYLEITTANGYYYTNRWDSPMEEHLFGTDQETAYGLYPENYTAQVLFVADRHAAVSQEAQDDSLLLSCYDLNTGLRTSAVTVPYDFNLINAVTGPGEKYLYLLCLDEESYICRWDPQAAPTDDVAIYTSRRYTMRDPDIAGLTRCREKADELEARFDVNILLEAEAAGVQPWDYSIEPEHQVPVIWEMLTKMEAALEEFPEGFFTALAEGTTSNRVNFCLVRRLQGSYESGSLDTATGIQFWYDEDAYVALTMDGDFTYNFYHELFHVIDTRVLSHCNSYDTWNTLNPKGFHYDNDYITNQDRDGSAYLGDSDRSFIDTYSMSFPKEDRARIMEYASTPDNESYFATVTMQKKLKQLCLGIRKAFGLQKCTEEFLWEQYLDTPIAYQPKN